MGKLTLFALVLSSFSFATSIRSVALESIDTPLRLHQVDSVAKIIRVAADGEVFGGTCNMRVRFGFPGNGLRPMPPNPIQVDYSTCKWVTVKVLSKYEGRKMNRLVKDAADGDIHYPQPGDILCRALPTRNLLAQADNGSVLLRSGAYPCGPQTYNESAAAEELMEMLADLRAEYDQLVP